MAQPRGFCHAHRERPDPEPLPEGKLNSGRGEPQVDLPGRYAERMARKHLIVIGAVAAGLALIGSLASGGDDEAAPVKTMAPSTSAPAPEPVSECVTIAPVVAQGLAEAADTSASRFGGIKAHDSETWLVAVEFADSPAAGEVAVFEVASITEAGQTRAVDGFAKTFTNFPESSYAGDPAIADAKACIQ